MLTMQFNIFFLEAHKLIIFQVPHCIYSPDLFILDICIMRSSINRSQNDKEQFSLGLLHWISENSRGLSGISQVVTGEAHETLKRLVFCLAWVVLMPHYLPRDHQILPVRQPLTVSAVSQSSQEHVPLVALLPGLRVGTEGWWEEEMCGGSSCSALVTMPSHYEAPAGRGLWTPWVIVVITGGDCATLKWEFRDKVLWHR